MTFVRIPSGHEGVTIDASPEKPKEIVPQADVHLVFPGTFGTEGLGARQPRTIMTTVNVRTPDGAPTKVRVKSTPGVSHDYPGAA